MPGITLNGTNQYLELNSKIVSGFPFSMVIWVAPSFTGSSQFWLAQQQSNADRYAALWLDPNGVNRYANVRNPGIGSSANVSGAPQVSSSVLRLAVGSFVSTTSRTMRFGTSSNSASDATAVTDDITNHDRITIGAWRYNNGAAGLYFPGTLCEAHFFNRELLAADFDTLLTTPPEQVSGWIDGWALSSASDLTSIGGTRTLTAYNSPTTGSLASPYTRAPAGSLVPRLDRLCRGFLRGLSRGI